MSIYLNKISNDLFADELFFSNLLSNNSKHTKVLKTDIIENDNDYMIIIDVAGVNKEDINISLEDKKLSVEVEYKENEKYAYLLKERFIGSAKRSFYVGDVDKKDIEASHENGLLIIKFSKESYKKANEKKTISIN